MSGAGFLLNPRLRRQWTEAESRASLKTIGDGEWASRQLQLLQRVWIDACADIPYYGRLVDTGAAPRELQTWHDVAAIPPLTRDALQDRAGEFIRRSGAPAAFMRTAGSTGTPLRIGMGQAERDLMRIVKLSAWLEFGYTPSARLFLIWGHSHLLGTGARGALNHVKRVMTDRVLGYKRVDAYRLNPAVCAEYAEALIAFRPIGLVSYAAALDVFARHTTAYRERFRELGLRFVLATAEPAPRSDTHARLEDLFGCPVVEEYGGAEFGQVAFNAGARRFDVYHDLNHVEAVAGDADGETVLITSLYPRYLPLIRYKVGDAITGVSRMPHGHVKSFDCVAGRINDSLRLPGGDMIHSVAIFHCIHQEDQVHAIQVVVNDSGIQINLVAGDRERSAMEQRIRERLRQVHSALAAARFAYVDDVRTTRAGKRRWFIDERTTVPCAESPAS